jgi:hypothetical protein
MFSHQELAEIVIDVSLATCFVGLFYLTISKDLEERAIERNISSLVDSIIPVKIMKSNNELDSYRSLMCNRIMSASETDKRPTQELDAKVEASNKKLVQQTAKAFGFLLLIGILLSILICRRGNLKGTPVNIKDLLVHCSAIIASVAIAEYTFFKIVLGRTMFIDLNDVLSVISQK